MTFFGWADGIADALFNISLPEGRNAATALLIKGRNGSGREASHCSTSAAASVPATRSSGRSSCSVRVRGHCCT